MVEGTGVLRTPRVMSDPLMMEVLATVRTTGVAVGSLPG